MRVTIRNAVPDDAPFLALIMQTAGRSQCERGFWDIFFPLPEPERLSLIARLSLTEAKSYFHYSYFMVAEADYTPAAALSGYDTAWNGLKAFIASLNDIGFKDDKLHSLLSRLGPFMSCYPETPEGLWIIESVAALPDFRRRGLVLNLLEHMLNRGRELGHKKAQITVQIGNSAAREVYMKAGFIFVKSKSTPEYEKDFGAPGLETLQMDL